MNSRASLKSPKEHLKRLDEINAKLGWTRMAECPVAAMETVSFSLKSITDAQVETDVVPAILTAAMAIAPESDGTSTPLKIDLSCNAITVKGIRAIIQCIESANVNVVALDVSANKLGDEGLIALAQFLSADKSLRYLDVHANHITDKGAFELCKALKSNEGLKAFDITANDLSGAGESELESVVGLSNGALQSLTGVERMQQFESVCIIA